MTSSRPEGSRLGVTRAGLRGRKLDLSDGELEALDMLDVVTIDNGLWRSALILVGVLASLGEDGGDRGDGNEGCSASWYGLD